MKRNSRLLLLLALVPVLIVGAAWAYRLSVPQPSPPDPVTFDLSGARRARLWYQYAGTNSMVRMFASDDTPEGRLALSLFQYPLTGDSQSFLPCPEQDNPFLEDQDHFAFSLTFYRDGTDDSEILKFYFYLSYPRQNFIRCNDVFYIPTRDLGQPSPEYPELAPWRAAGEIIGVDNWVLGSPEFPIDGPIWD